MVKSALMNALPPEKEYYSIGEAARAAGVKAHVLRYWEREFAALRPVRRASGHRKFTRRDLETIRRLKSLLHEQRFTVAGAKKLLKQEARRGPAQAALELDDSSAAVQTLKEVKAEIAEILDALRASDPS